MKCPQKDDPTISPEEQLCYDNFYQQDILDDPKTRKIIAFKQAIKPVYKNLEKYQVL